MAADDPVDLMDESTVTLHADLAPDAEPETAPEWVTVEKSAPEFSPILPDEGVSKLIGLLVTAVTLAFAAGFTWVNLHPRLLLTNSTPAGGDMGAHVWGPAYLRDHLLPDFRLTGWTKDWYSGFPAYQYYMVVPALMIVALDLFLPYAIAFKLISVAGLVAMPLCAASMARNFGMRFPGPGIVGLMMLPFLWDTTWTIYGGNVASNLAGEFSFTLSLCFSMLFLGVLAKGLETGRHRVRAAVLFALVALCHPLPLLGLVLVGIVAVALWQIGAIISSPKPAPGTPGRLRALGSSLWWGISALGVGSALSAFWIVPFIGKGDYLNDMGWVKLATTSEKVLFYLFHLGSEDGTKPLFNAVCADQSSIYNLSMQFWLVAVVFAIVGAVLSVVLREKLGIVLIMIAAGTSAAFMLMPQHRFWNARVLPFWYLSVYLLTAVGVSLMVSWIRSAIPRATALVAFATVVTVVVGLGLAMPPSKQVGGRNEISLGAFTIGDRSNFTESWARWNYEGYEGKPAYPEYRAVVNEMDRIGQTNGCGRAMWEYDNDRLNRYGTPMALMLLPHWTDGCIGSMEGLFFESSPTTAFHFLNQSELSARPSRPQTDLPYRETDVTQGVKHLQLLGVRYYLAFSESVVTAARANPDLVEIGQVGGDEAMVKAEREANAPAQDRIDRALPWVVFEVQGSSLVEPLNFLPAILQGVDDGQHEWLDPATEFYNDPTRWDVLPASDGPGAWPVTTVGELPPRVAVAPAKVTKIREENERVSFTVDKVGTPVLVKTSYFPNWKVKGALGPYRVMPNLMVVVPTENQVELSYGYTGLDWGAYGLSGAALLGMAALAVRRRPLRTLPALAPVGSVDSEDWPTGTDTDDESGWAALAAAGAGVTQRVPGITPPLPPPDFDTGDPARQPLAIDHVDAATEPLESSATLLIGSAASPEAVPTPLPDANGEATQDHRDALDPLVTPSTFESLIKRLPNREAPAAAAAPLESQPGPVSPLERAENGRHGMVGPGAVGTNGAGSSHEPPDGSAHS